MNGLAVALARVRINDLHHNNNTWNFAIFIHLFSANRLIWCIIYLTNVIDTNGFELIDRICER